MLTCALSIAGLNPHDWLVSPRSYHYSARLARTVQTVRNAAFRESVNCLFVIPLLPLNLANLGGSKSRLLFEQPQGCPACDRSMLSPVSGEDNAGFKFARRVEQLSHCVSTEKSRFVDPDDLVLDFPLQVLIEQQAGDRIGLLESDFAKCAQAGVS